MAEMSTDEGVTVDFCSGCRGMFFDGGEVAAYFELTEDLPTGVATVTPATRSAPACPRCQAAMAQVRYTRDSSLVLDRCTRCNGMWLDAGEAPRLHHLSASLGHPGARLRMTLERLDRAGYALIGVQGGQ